ncbi:M56 family metallopeptidase [Paenibacillus tarimensis]|uniref:M56 family metallopeptidase n=1 Tax=Paenibacillus tarimensis TaxID=416012 RepID=UPI001F1965BB|nr:M56 family metallopeptidase [Paenibacillus tarimensis]MCF2944778.1 M56 family metallopeptidase [Paenibacillus tarimensis]
MLIRRHGSFACIIMIGLLVYSLLSFILLKDWITFRPGWWWLSWFHDAVRTRGWAYNGAVLLLQIMALVIMIRTLWYALQIWLLHRRSMSRLLASTAEPGQYEIPASLKKLLGYPVMIIPSGKLSAFAAGWLRPRIVVTTGLLSLFDSEELKAILLHEQYHCRQRDPLRLYIVKVLGKSLRFVPVLRGLVDYYIIWDELCADRYVIRNMRTSEGLAGVLLKWSAARRSAPPVHEAAAVAYFAPTAMNYRILQLLEPGREPEVPLMKLRKAAVTAAGLLFIFMMSVDVCG